MPESATSPAPAAADPMGEIRRIARAGIERAARSEARLRSVAQILKAQRQQLDDMIAALEDTRHG